jgi:hypothetical protein
MLSSVLRSRSVSSICRMKVPPCWRAQSQLYKAVRTPPMCKYPVGEGAKRTRTSDMAGALPAPRDLVKRRASYPWPAGLALA